MKPWPSNRFELDAHLDDEHGMGDSVSAGFGYGELFIAHATWHRDEDQDHEHQ